MWAEWKEEYNKEYLLSEEEESRINIFYNNYRTYKEWTDSEEG